MIGVCSNGASAQSDCSRIYHYDIYILDYDGRLEVCLVVAVSFVSIWRVGKAFVLSSRRRRIAESIASTIR